MKVILLAGGEGTRLKPLTNFIPKPLIKIGNKPLIMYPINFFKNQGFNKFIITVSYLSTEIKKYLGNGSKFNVKINYLNEKHPLGTAGGIRNLEKLIKSTFIVSAADIIRQCDLNKILAFHKKNGGAATICVYKNKRHKPKSLIYFDSNYKIKKFIERPKYLPKGIIWSNASLYVLEPKIFSFIPKNSISDFGMDIFPKLLENGEKIFAYQAEGLFLDVGTKDKILVAEKYLKKYKIR